MKQYLDSIIADTERYSAVRQHRQMKWTISLPVTAKLYSALRKQRHQSFGQHHSRNNISFTRIQDNGAHNRMNRVTIRCHSFRFFLRPRERTLSRSFCEEATLHPASFSYLNLVFPCSNGKYILQQQSVAKQQQQLIAITLSIFLSAKLHNKFFTDEAGRWIAVKLQKFMPRVMISQKVFLENGGKR